MTGGSTTTVGHSFPRMEGRAKVTGQADYIYNMRLPSMLHAKVHRSPISHGRIRSINTAAAAAMPGVHQVITGEDVKAVLPEPYYGPAFHDQPILALEKVRHFGEPVAVVLAPDPHVAETAAQRIVVDYEELPAVFDEVEALTSEAIVHEELKPAGTFADLKHLSGKRDTNIALDFHLNHGDADKAFAEAAHVFEHTFRTQQTMHTPFEPMVALADVRNDRAEIFSSTQSPSFVRFELSRLLGWPESNVRVKTSHLGGGFGAKVYVKVEALAMALSLIAHRPVRVAQTMEEQFYTITKHPNTFRIRSAVDGDGRITGRKCEVWWNGGAYADIGPRVTQKSGFTAAGPYDIDNIDIDSFALYTNRPPAGALRGFGIPQLVWAYESHTDIIASELGLDPVDFRKRNILRNGRPQAVGTIVEDGEFEAVLDGVAQRLGWNRPFDKGSGTKRRGRGVAIGFKASISPTTSSAIVSVNADGSVIVYCSTVDMGQGSDTAMAQIAAEVLDVPLDLIRVVNPDTDVTPYDMSTLGSRSTFHMGHAVQLAATDARDKLRAMADEVGLPEGSNAPLPELFIKKFGMRAGTVVGAANYKPDYAPPNYETGQSPNATPFWMIGAAGAEVEVDTETGQFRILRLVNVCDIGKPINPEVVETQISGAAVMQLGFTLTETMIIENGQLTNPSLADYKIPGLFDMPDVMENGFIEAEQHNGPFGAKGAGESGTFGVSPAIANAIADAVGVRITEMPITAEAIFRALREKAGRPLEDV
ncbi:MAG: molybdopterin-dependent oxidoreductase [Alphaproteobacteria bacterium]|nr:molybdopterin-dependent oxidoreductase [Alphaproteobacteria bacterium]